MADALETLIDAQQKKFSAWKKKDTGFYWLLLGEYANTHPDTNAYIDEYPSIIFHLGKNFDPNKKSSKEVKAVNSNLVIYQNALSIKSINPKFAWSGNYTVSNNGKTWTFGSPLLNPKDLSRFIENERQKASLAILLWSFLPKEAETVMWGTEVLNKPIKKLYVHPFTEWKVSTLLRIAARENDIRPFKYFTLDPQIVITVKISIGLKLITERNPVLIQKFYDVAVAEAKAQATKVLRDINALEDVIITKKEEAKEKIEKLTAKLHAACNEKADTGKSHNLCKYAKKINESNIASIKAFSELSTKTEKAIKELIQTFTKDVSMKCNERIEACWADFCRYKNLYRNYQFKAGLSVVTKGVGVVAAGALTVVSGWSAGGAIGGGLATLRNLIGFVSNILILLKSAEEVGEKLKKDIISLLPGLGSGKKDKDFYEQIEREFNNNKNQSESGTFLPQIQGKIQKNSTKTGFKELGKSAITRLTNIRITSIKTIREDLRTYEEKLNGCYVNSITAGPKLAAILELLNSLEQCKIDNRSIMSNELTMQLKKSKALSQELTQILTFISRHMEIYETGVKEREKFKKLIATLQKGVPGWARKIEKFMPLMDLAFVPCGDPISVATSGISTLMSSGAEIILPSIVTKISKSPKATDLAQGLAAGFDPILNGEQISLIYILKDFKHVKAS